MEQVENPMVMDGLRERNEPKVVGECEGCHEAIYEGEDVYDFDGGLVHQDPDCCMQYVANISYCKVAGE
ncbi:hypothetical protein [Peribacillus asahii]|uniref:hypothetical protein n=1 Tax=Peribacillus asahii TaxID=228899 RepID=UPI00207A01AA|nr:hypothetical protein [Peribacillus asahii]USK61305.1 hypothetical protein LIT37_08310 [Peribacillus asahii]